MTLTIRIKSNNVLKININTMTSIQITKIVKQLFYVGLLFYAIATKGQSTKDNAPEMYKFDALGTSNLIDIPTGSFNYSVPVLNVPGPEGGYDVRLTYSAGIRMEQDASWVGLGWSCSPGAIVRTVNGSPDDIKEYENINLNQDYGTESVPDVQIIDFFDKVHGQWSTSATGNEIAWQSSGFMLGGGTYDTYTNSVSSRTIVYLSLAIQDGLNNATSNYSQSVGAGDNGGNKGFSTANTISNTQVSHTGGELSFSLDGGGQNTLFYDVGHYSDLYWEAYSNYSSYTSGSFYLGNGFEKDPTELWRQTYTRSMDVYTNQTAYDQNVVGTNNLSFPAYDEYSVSADGLSGILSPITMRDAPLFGNGETVGNTFNQYVVDLTNPTNQYTPNAAFESSNQNKLSFIFRGEHASVRNTPGNFNIAGSTITTTPGSLIHSGGYCTGNNKVMGGKNVKTTLDVDGQIIGFSITNEQGMTYNFNFPVYQFERIQSSSDTKYANAKNIKILKKKYAYAWLLTSITGADYINNGSGDVDETDGGYWVKFNYGKWTTGFVWSDNYDGRKQAKSITDEDKTKTVSFNQLGIKELAYLNSVETRSHIAYFAKFVREDGLGSNLELNESITLNQNKEIKTNEAFDAWSLEYESNDNTSFVPSGYFDSDKCFTSEIHEKLDANGHTIYIAASGTNQLEITWSKYKLENYAIGKKFIGDQNSLTTIKLENHVGSTSTMDKKQRVLGLKKIILVNRENTLASCALAYPSATLGVNASDDVSFTVNTTILNPELNGNPVFNKYGYVSPCVTATPITSIIGQPTYSTGSRKKYYEANVVDIADIANSTIESKALQIVELNYDYSLCENSPNSLPLTIGASTNKGKLTLKSIDIKDGTGNKVSPSNLFTYGLNPSYEEVNVGTTLNPEWLKMQDDWGYRVATNTNLNHIANKDEAQKELASAWSLTEIQTPTGGKIKINYESDTYIREAATTKNTDAQIKSFEVNSSTNCRNTMTLPLQLGFGSTPVFIVGHSYSIHLTPVHSISCPSCPNQFPILTGEYLSASSSGSNMYATFNIISGWDSDDDFNFLYSSYVPDENNINRTFDALSKRSECNSIKIKYEEGINVSSAFIVGHNYSISLYGDNLTAWAGSIYNASTPLIISNAIAQSINATTNEVSFSLAGYDLNYSNSLSPDAYSFSTGELNDRVFFGGGVRVKELIMQDENNNQYKTNYEYQNGVTSFAPSNLWRKDVKYITELPSPGVLYGKVIEKNVGANNNSNSITEYEYETMVSNTAGQDLAYGDQLYIENRNIQTASYTQPATYSGGTDNVNIHTRVGTIQNNTGKIGRIKEIQHKNNDGVVLSFEKYNYLPKENAASGVAQESFHDNRRKTLSVWPNYYSDIYYTYSSRIFYPTELGSIERHKSNIVTYAKYGSLSAPNNGFDIYTHQPLITENTKASGEIFRSKSILAYTKYPEMASTICNASNKNMIGVIAEQIEYVIDASSVEKVLGASVTTFSKNWNYRQYNTTSNNYENVNSTDVYRLDKTYTWKSLLDVNGTIPSFVDFDWTAGASNVNWQKTTASSLFNHYSKGLEVTDLNGNYSSSKFGYNNSFIVASGANAKYTAFAFSSAEDVADGNYFGSEVLGANKRYLNTAFAHTGKYSVKLNAGETGFSFGGSVGLTNNEDFKNGQKIRANVWLHKLNAINGKLEYVIYAPDGITVLASGFVDKNSTSTKAVGTNWYLLTLDFTISVPAFSSGTAKLVVRTTNAGTSSVYFDDFKVHPTEAIVSASVYDEKTGWISATLDSDNFGTKYYYDTAGRLIRVDKETLDGWKKLSENSYHYGRP
jgi:hypothetical protein